MHTHLIRAPLITSGTVEFWLQGSSTTALGAARRSGVPRMQGQGLRVAPSGLAGEM